MAQENRFLRREAAPRTAPEAREAAPRMTPERLKEARQILERYRAGKAALDKRIVENQQWYRLRHWEHLRKSANPQDPEPASAWLLNSIANKHADAMDNFPEPVVLPREEGDRRDAQLLSQVLPAVLERNQFESAYSQMWWRKLKTGTGAYGVFWDSAKLNGLGDIQVRAVDILNLYWEPGVGDLQQSRNLFCVALQDDDALLARYPQLAGRLGGGAGQTRQYVHDEHIDLTGKSLVVDWYYRAGGLMHFCKFVNGVCLYASEDDPACQDRGFYHHGQYPFVLDVLFPDEDSPAGFGYLDVCKDPQMRIDKLNQALVKNAVMAARPRFFIKGDGAVNEAEFADWDRDLVHFNAGGDPAQSIMPIQTPGLPSGVASVLRDTIEELKETSGNRDFSQGGASNGVTAASAIAALQEAGSKLSRDMIKASYRAFVGVCTLCLELMRQFYTVPRCFRVVGQRGAAQFLSFDNAGLLPRPQGFDFGVDLGARVPVFDIVVKAQKASPFAVVAQNELAKEFYAAGFFQPQMADQALACLDMMTFDGKDQVVERIAQNATLYRQLQAMRRQAAQMAALMGAQSSASLAQPAGQTRTGRPSASQPGASQPSASQPGASQTQVNTLGAPVSQSPTAAAARQRAAQAAQVK